MTEILLIIRVLLLILLLYSCNTNYKKNNPKSINDKNFEKKYIFIIDKESLPEAKRRHISLNIKKDTLVFLPYNKKSLKIKPYNFKQDSITVSITGDVDKDNIKLYSNGILIYNNSKFRQWRSNGRADLFYLKKPKNIGLSINNSDLVIFPYDSIYNNMEINVKSRGNMDSIFIKQILIPYPRH